VPSAIEAPASPEKFDIGVRLSAAANSPDTCGFMQPLTGSQRKAKTGEKAEFTCCK
jgi:hypothetical protein